MAAEAGLDWSQYNYANLLATGRGVAEDQPQALTFYRLAAEQGHAKSMNLVGRYLEDGRFCQRDLEAAVDWYRRSAEGVGGREFEVPAYSVQGVGRSE